jgi:hypothetical protein
MRENGSTTILIFGVLLFLSVLFLGAYALLQYTVKEVYRSEKDEKVKKLLREEAERVIALLLDDPTPRADSLKDPVWELIETPIHEDVSITLNDLSSYYGINWIRKEILNHGVLLKFGKTTNEFQQYRWESGLQLKMEPIYTEFFTSDMLTSYFTPYNYFNINISDEFVLENVFLIRTGNEIEAKQFRQKVQETWKKSKPGKPNMIESEKLSNFLGEEYDVLFPIINAEPVINIHFAPEDILYQLFSYKYHDIPKSTAEFFINNRDNMEWSIEELNVIIGAKYQKTFLHHYIGATTWFWEINITKSDEENASEASEASKHLRWIIARIPGEKKGDERVEFRLIEEEFSL